MPIVLTVLINFTVNYLLLLACARLYRREPALIRTLLAAGIGAIHVLVCFLPGFHVVGGTFIRFAVILLMSVAAFGISRRQLRLHAVFLLLCLAMDGIAGNGVAAVFSGIVMLAFLFFEKMKREKIVPVSLQYGSRKLALTALWDTGNCLKDPVTGASVLVIGAEAARYLTGLTAQQLKKPLETIGAIPGLRLIPYRAVGSSGFLLALRLPKVRIGSWQGSHIVAFAPEGLENNGGFDALIGGNL